MQPKPGAFCLAASKGPAIHLLALGSSASRSSCARSDVACILLRGIWYLCIGEQVWRGEIILPDSQCGVLDVAQMQPQAEYSEGETKEFISAQVIARIHQQEPPAPFGELLEKQADDDLKN